MFSDTHRNFTHAFLIYLASETKLLVLFRDAVVAGVLMLASQSFDKASIHNRFTLLTSCSISTTNVNCSHAHHLSPWASYPCTQPPIISHHLSCTLSKQSASHLIHMRSPSKQTPVTMSHFNCLARGGKLVQFSRLTQVSRGRSKWGVSPFLYK